jgi:hypothetical protein
VIAIVTAALAALVSLAVGLPWALALRRTRDDVVDLVTDAVLVGIVLTVSGLTLYSWLGWAGLILSVVVELAVVAWMLRRRRLLVWPPMPVRRDVVFIVVLAVVLAVALVLRRHTIDFITYTGDMGAYVNWANQFLRTGGLHASWPPFYPMFLVFGGLLTGAKGVTAIVAVTGLLLILGLVRILRILGVNPWVALVVGGVVAVHPQSIWFSQIPLSESLNAPLIVLWLTSVAATLTSDKLGRWSWAFVGGVSILALSLLRGTAPILVAPLVLIAIVALVAPRWRHLAPRLWLLVATNGAGSAIGFWYGVERIPSYYVTTQIRQLLPGGLYSRLVDVGVLKVGAVSAITAILVIVVLAVVYWLVRRFTTASDDAETVAGEAVADRLTVGIGVRVIEVLGAALILIAVVDSDLRHSEVWNSLHREAFLLVIVAIIAPALLAVTRHGRVEASIAIMSSVIAAVFIQLQTGRLQGTKTHSTFLYWDRYLYSEFFPVMMILVGVLFGIAYRLLRVRLDPATFAFASRRPGASQVALTGLAIAVVAYVLVKAVLPVSSYIQQNTLLLGAGAIETKLQYEMADVDKPFLWGGSTEGSVPGTGFPNTWMAFATPLAISYGREYANSQQGEAKGDFSPDPVLTERDVDTAMACTRSSSVYVVESETTGPSFATRMAGTDLRVERLATIKQDVVQLSQLVTPDKWHVASYDLKVYEVTAPSTPTATHGTCDAIPGP